MQGCRKCGFPRREYARYIFHVTDHKAPSNRGGLTSVLIHDLHCKVWEKQIQGEEQSRGCIARLLFFICFCGALFWHPCSDLYYSAFFGTCQAICVKLLIFFKKFFIMK
uniref:Uncharacterized protein n=1 Tax=Siphoviridae sp. cttDR14 TaxID=2826490 RepID=A0A8S5M1X7_9CAUD|nr:MAG TPA: hypothetical protein [Siphoviridae sp. cttDR14]